MYEDYAEDGGPLLVSDAVRIASRDQDVEFQPGCHRVERNGFVIGRYITDSAGHIRWHVVYAAAGMDATLDTLLDAAIRSEGR